MGMAEGMKSLPSCLEDGTGCPSYVSPMFIEKFKKANKDDMNPKNLKCPPEFSSFCYNIKQQSVRDIIRFAKFPVISCHNRNDQTAPYEDINRRYPNNTYLSQLPTEQQWSRAEEKRGKKYAHIESSYLCAYHATLELITRRG